MAPGPAQAVKQSSFDISLGHPPTSTRIPAVDADESITKPGVPRANAAVSSSSPGGDRLYTERFKNYVCPPGATNESTRASLQDLQLANTRSAWRCRRSSSNTVYSGTATVTARFFLGTLTLGSGSWVSTSSFRFSQCSSSTLASRTPRAWHTRGFRTPSSVFTSTQYTRPR